MFPQFRTLHLFAALSIVALGIAILTFVSRDVVELRNVGSERVVSGKLTIGEKQSDFGVLQPGSKLSIRVSSKERTTVLVTATTESGRAISEEIYLPNSFPGTRAVVELE